MMDWLKKLFNGCRRSFTDYPDHVRTAAYCWIKPVSIRPSYLGGKLDQIPRAKAHYQRRRGDAESINNEELKNCVLAWLDYFEERSIPKDEAELKDQTSRKELDAYKARQVEHDRKVRQLLDNTT